MLRAPDDVPSAELRSTRYGKQIVAILRLPVGRSILLECPTKIAVERLRSSIYETFRRHKINFRGHYRMTCANDRPHTLRVMRLDQPEILIYDEPLPLEETQA